MDQREYFFSLKKFIVFAFFFFLFSILMGFLAARFFPDRLLDFLTVLKAVYGQVATLEKTRQLLFVVFNNALVLFLVLVLSIFFGFFPIAVLFANGFVLGALFFFLRPSLPLSLFLLSVLPHGLFEIPALIAAVSSGLKIASKAMAMIFKKENSLRREFFLALKFFLFILMPLLFSAGLIEIYLVPFLINKLI